MPTRSLPSLSDGSDIFIDANVFIYALSGQSAQCRGLLGRCSREEVTGITLFEIVNEATHRFMLAEAKAKDHIGSVSSVQQLRSRCEKSNVISTLIDYWQQTERILSLNLLFLSSDESIVRDAQAQRSAACLLTNDSMVVACMRQYGVYFIASADRDFERASGITLFCPDDLP